MFIFSSGSLKSDAAQKQGVKAVIHKPIHQTHLYDMLVSRTSHHGAVLPGNRNVAAGLSFFRAKFYSLMMNRLTRK
jgi:hypothetical protein